MTIDRRSFSASRQIALALIAIFLLTTMVSVGQAQTGYPNKPIRMIVPYSPGGTTSIAARVLADELGAELGQTIVVENRPGAGTAIGTSAVHRADPDGYTLGFLTQAMTTVPVVQKDLTWKPTDFVAISKVADVALYIAVHPDVPAKNLKELFELIKKSPGKLTYSTSGSGNSQHLGFEALKIQHDLIIRNVPYKGASEALLDVLGGRVDVTYQGSGLIPLAKEGKLRILATTSDKRTPDAPDVPTMAEAGFKDFVLATWFGLFAPPNTPKEIVAKLSDAMAKAAAKNSFRDPLVKGGIVPLGTDAATLSKAISDDTERWKAVTAKVEIKE